MITVIKPGKKQVFKMECKRCFAEFTYELEDLEHSTDILDNKSRSIICCPCCGAQLDHEFNTGYVWLEVPSSKTKKEQPNADKVLVTPPQPFQDQMDCAQCPYASGLGTDGKIFVGDTPCTWCKNRQFTCTSDSSNITISNIHAYNNDKTPIKDFMLHGEIKETNNDISTTISNS